MQQKDQASYLRKERGQMKETGCSPVGRATKAYLGFVQELVSPVDGADRLSSSRGRSHHRRAAGEHVLGPHQWRGTVLLKVASCLFKHLRTAGKWL
jgi:hypothetical protein